MEPFDRNGKETILTSTRYDRPELDLLRLLAFAAVFAFHHLDYAGIDGRRHPWLIDFSTVGAFGVALFFLLSAFLITELLQRERTAVGTIHIGAFYVRRALRIWPLYFAAFYGLAALNTVLHDVGTTDPAAWLAFSTFTGNWYVTLRGWIAGPVDPLWSISVEEQFYLVAPFVIAFCGRRAVVALCLATVAVSYGVIWHYAAHPVDGDNGQWTNGFVQYQFFAAGILLSLFLRGRMPAWPLAARIAGVLLGVGCWLAAFWACGVKSWDSRAAPVEALCGWMLVLLGAAIVFVSMLGLERRLVPRALAYGGRISYGLYVFHSLILYLVFHVGGEWLRGRGVGLPTGIMTALSLLLTFVAAHLSYRYFERPFIRLKDRFAFVRRHADVAPSTPATPTDIPAATRR